VIPEMPERSPTQAYLRVYDVLRDSCYPLTELEERQLFLSVLRLVTGLLARYHSIDAARWLDVWQFETQVRRNLDWLPGTEEQE
jgi:hypothetical protein